MNRTTEIHITYLIDVISLHASYLSITIVVIFVKPIAFMPGQPNELCLGRTPELLNHLSDTI